MIAGQHGLFIGIVRNPGPMLPKLLLEEHGKGLPVGQPAMLGFR
jgi:hypothetical protein